MTQQELAAHYDRLEAEAGLTKESMNNKEIETYFANCSVNEMEAFVDRQVEELKDSLREIRRHEAILLASGEPVETYYFPNAEVTHPQPTTTTTTTTTETTNV